MPQRFTAISVDIWNRKLHLYLGLFFLWLIWLFSFTGLLLNHPKWTFAEFWANRKQSEFTETITLPKETDDLEIARNLMSQLGIAGEIDWTNTRPASNRFDFRVSRPGHLYEVDADLKSEKAVVRSIQTNGWGIIRMLHTFTGVRAADPKAQRDWWATKLWSFSMDAVSIGLIFFVVSGLILWLKMKSGRILGILFLGLGILSCGFFVFGLSWI